MSLCKRQIPNGIRSSSAAISRSKTSILTFCSTSWSALPKFEVTETNFVGCFHLLSARLRPCFSARLHSEKSNINILDTNQGNFEDLHPLEDKLEGSSRPVAEFDLETRIGGLNWCSATSFSSSSQKHTEIWQKCEHSRFVFHRSPACLQRATLWNTFRDQWSGHYYHFLVGNARFPVFGSRWGLGGPSICSRPEFFIELTKLVFQYLFRIRSIMIIVLTLLIANKSNASRW